jgi:hypothetical protein
MGRLLPVCIIHLGAAMDKMRQSVEHAQLSVGDVDQFDELDKSGEGVFRVSTLQPFSEYSIFNEILHPGERFWSSTNPTVSVLWAQ